MDSIQFILILILFLTIFVIPYAFYKIFSYYSKKWLFTIIIVLYYFFIIFPAINDFLYIERRSKIITVRANSYNLKTIVDRYYADNKSYPKNIDELKKEASESKLPYWKELKNPFTENKGKGESYDDFQRILINEKISLPELRKEGVVYYSPIFNKKGQVVKYFIYASGKDTFLIKDNPTKFFTLTNN